MRVVLRVLARTKPTSQSCTHPPMVVDVQHMRATGHVVGAPRRFVGRTHDASLGKNGGWPHKSEPTEIVIDPDQDDFSADTFATYRQHLQDGSLWAADQATADVCGVKFDSKFGGEHDAPKASAPADAPKSKEMSANG